ncbi:aliphatic sulfonate ABC transporter substrate-binding protein [Phenylobacterium sp.]|uniref:aliphatic sulfonate ABC transporter substrate-binding protein n=1 Tax=Phenylobacterium sp. TaxID=1871053 RepID=UPI00301D2028
MTPRLRRRALLSGALAGGLLAAGCARTPVGAEAIRIGYQRSGVLLLAKARGRLPERLGRPVQWIEFPSGPPLMEALAAGAVDFGAVGDAPPLFAQAARVAFVYVARQPVTGAGSALLVPPGSAVGSVADLRARRIAFTKATSAHLFTHFALRQAGLRLADVTQVHLSPGDAAAAFRSGQFDAWATWDPYYALAVRDQGARVLLTGEGLPLTNGFYLASRRFAEHAPDRLSALLTALKGEAEWGVAHVDEVSGVVSDATGLPRDIVQAALRRGPFAVAPLDAETMAAQQDAADAFLEIGALPARIDVTEAVWSGWDG